MVPGWYRYGITETVGTTMAAGQYLGAYIQVTPTGGGLPASMYTNNTSGTGPSFTAGDQRQVWSDPFYVSSSPSLFNLRVNIQCAAASGTFQTQISNAFLRQIDNPYQ
jgi:hypothetical protein